MIARSSAGRIVLESRDRIGVEQRGPAGLQHGERPGAGFLAGSRTGPDEECRETTIVQQAVEIFRRRQRVGP